MEPMPEVLCFDNAEHNHGRGFGFVAARFHRTLRDARQLRNGAPQSTIADGGIAFNFLQDFRFLFIWDKPAYSIGARWAWQGAFCSA